MTQDQAFDILASGASVFLTGQPGAGKTHTVNRYVAWLREHGIEPALVASTGIAATHIGGMTVHSWAGIGIADALSPRDLDRIASTEKVGKRISKAKVLILDEVSMLAANVLGMVDAVCRAVRRNNAPFGGLQTVLVGDFFQLPPVSRPGTKPEYAFRSDAWLRLSPVVCYLDEQHRQHRDDADFVAVLSAIRCDAVDQEHHAILRGRMSGHDAAPKDAPRLFPHNAEVDRINDLQLAKLGGAERMFVMRAVGPEHLVATLVRGCLSPEKLRLKVGAAVMFTRNSPQGRFANGTLGTVTAFDEAGQVVVRTRSGATITVEPMEWAIDDQGKVLASLSQLPLRLAWAMTIHKSQGMSLDAAVMDLSGTFEYGQGYVALSRVRRLSGLHLLGCNERALQVHPDIVTQDRQFLEQSLDAERAAMAFTEAQRADARKRFVILCGGKFPAPGTAHAAGTRGVHAGTPGSAGGPRSGVAPDGSPITTASGWPKGEGSIQALRATHPKAFARWSADEERQLEQAFKGGASINDIAEKMGRKRGGISSRLKKLGLME